MTGVSSVQAGVHYWVLSINAFLEKRVDLYYYCNGSLEMWTLDS